MTDYTKMDGPALQEACGDRAELWAEAFCQRRYTRFSKPLMIKWLSMAIEASHTVRMRRHLAEPSPTWREEAEDATAYIAARPAWPDDADQALWDGSQWTPEQARMLAAKTKS